jgi:hypothetical protein
MSGRPSSAHSPKRAARLVSAAAFAALCAGGCGIAAAEEPVKQSQNDPNPPARKLDAESPVPADGRHTRASQKYAMPATDRLMFSKIEDFKPVASEETNALEYEAWGEFVRQAAKFPAAELERHGVRDLTVIDLLKQYRTFYRCELLRFDGKLVCVRRLKAPLSFQNNPASKVKELYEARFVPLDESPLTPMSVVFLDLPESLAAVRDRPYREWVDAGAWVSAAGYYFKTMSVAGDRGGPVNVPVLVGRGVTPLPGPPAPPGGDPTALEPVRLFKFIRDDAAMIRNAPGDGDWPELAAQNRVLIHASRFGAEELEGHAADVKFADLFEPVRAAFKLRNVRMEGRLISLRKADPSPELRAAGIDAVYEGWLVPANEPRGNPVCVQFTGPLEGLGDPPKDGRVNRWVSFAGYSFKLMRYESAEQYDDPAKGYKVKRAPLLIGKSPVARRDPDAATPLRSGALAQAAMVGGVLLIAGAGGLAWWYRRGDRRSRAFAPRNPFDAGAPTAPRDF